MRPSTANLLRSLSYTFESAIMPAVSGDYQTSLCLTSGNMLRYVTELVEHAYELERRDVAQLRVLLDAIQRYLNSLPESGESLRELLSKLQQPDPPHTAPHTSPEELNALSMELKGRVDLALRFLTACPPALRDTPSYQQIRASIRRWLADSLLRERELMERAFISKRR